MCFSCHSSLWSIILSSNLLQDFLCSGALSMCRLQNLCTELPRSNIVASVCRVQRWKFSDYAAMHSSFPHELYVWVDGKKWNMPSLWQGEFLSYVGFFLPSKHQLPTSVALQMMLFVEDTWACCSKKSAGYYSQGEQEVTWEVHHHPHHHNCLCYHLSENIVIYVRYEALAISTA